MLKTVNKFNTKSTFKSNRAQNMSACMCQATPKLFTLQAFM